MCACDDPCSSMPDMVSSKDCAWCTCTFQHTLTVSVGITTVSLHAPPVTVSLSLFVGHGIVPSQRNP